ncbi:MAG TPA: tetratricopeptide repeat protein [Chthoniobacterales bacterium]|nr:tetratricopeptide repeat protein [Chthoniobacterales bacterium]
MRISAHLGWRRVRALAGGFLIFAFSWSNALCAETPADALAGANQQYKAGHFREAAELYQKAVTDGETSAALFYNLGNACFRAGNFGRAILNYERALALHPQHPEASANLHLTQDKARALELKTAWWDRLIGQVAPNTYAIAAATSAWLGAFCFVAWLFRKRRSALLVLFSLLLLASAIGAAAALFALETGNHGRALAIVVDREIEARVATADNAGSVLVLPAGSEIKIISTRGDWIYAALPNDLRGWIPAGSAERVRL